MPKKNGHRTLIILIIVMVSVILCSCGIPTFCDLSNISISSTSDISSFNVTGSDSDVSKITAGPGLTLCYYICDETDDYSSINSKMIKEFTSKSSPTLVINSDCSISEIEFSSGKYTDYTLYAFSINGVRPQSPVYNISLSPYVSGTTVSASFTGGSVDKTEKTYTISASSLDYTFSFEESDKTHEFTTDTRIVIFAALTSGAGNFSTPYWSKLVYLGYVDYDDI